MEMPKGWSFFPNLDYLGPSDWAFQNQQLDAPLSTLFSICYTDQNCKAFNTEGTMKKEFDGANLIEFHTGESCHGIFAKVDPRVCGAQLANEIPQGWKFYPKKNSPEGDMADYVHGAMYPSWVTEDLVTALRICDLDPDCKGFNTRGYVKKTIDVNKLVPMTWGGGLRWNICQGRY
jgi:hypothetical protein